MSAPFSPKTPMLQQYFRVKAERQDALLAMQVGDFYEFYGEDAEIAAKALEITLTGRDDGDNGRVAMSGFPIHAAERYIARLVQKGFKVAVCEQAEDPKTAKGLVKRKVTRVLTAGTLLQDSMLPEGKSNYLVAAVFGDPVHGLGVVDVSTGEFLVTEISGERRQEKLMDELARLEPAEILVPAEHDELIRELEAAIPASITPFDVQRDLPRDARSVLLHHFGVANLRGFGCEEYSRGIEAAAMTLKYLQKNEIAALGHIQTLSTYSVERFMHLDSIARRHLEVSQNLQDGSRRLTLLSTLDQTQTPMGARMLKRWLDEPLLDPNPINERLDAVELLTAKGLLREEIRALLSKNADIERLVGRAATGAANARDLVALRSSLRLLPHLREALCKLIDGETKSAKMVNIASVVQPIEGVQQMLDRSLLDDPPATLRDGGMIKPGCEPELDQLREMTKSGKAWIAELEAKEKAQHGLPLKIGYNAVFGYYIEISKIHSDKAPPHYIRKQTTANAERYITPELKEQEAALVGAQEKIIALEYDVFCRVREAVARESADLLRIARAIAELDAMASLAEVAVRHRYVRPSVNLEDRLEIVGGRHPVVERFGGVAFVPNDCLLDESDQRLIILTGPNMSGKSTYIRQVALIALLAQAGSFVPADRASIGIVDRIFTRVGARDELATGQSTFMVEMTETANILNNATPRSLVILDEIGRGTSTYDGLAIAWAVAEYLADIGCKTLFATHYHYLNELTRQSPGVKNFRVAVKEQGDKVVWLHKVLPGGADKSYGIQVAKMAGIPNTALDRARHILTRFEDKGTALPETAFSTKTVQLTLFEAAAHPVVDEIKRIDLSEMTPVEALVMLDQWKRKIETD
ncbi:MAG: DNA mismatch repair protein MutS [Armatimonadetes bacterium]|nr:DNA mismatch repair protein MutS [Armatimonadota bacterium]